MLFLIEHCEFFRLGEVLNIIIMKINNKLWNFPGGPVVKNPPSNAGDAGSIPGWGAKIPHATGQLSPCATTTQLTPQRERENPHATTRGKPAHRN